MKNFPLPSFFKIRLVALLVGFLVVCFLLGAAKHALAAYPGQCTYEYTDCTVDWIYTDYPPAGTFIFDHPPIFNAQTLSYDRGDGITVVTDSDQKRTYYLSVSQQPVCYIYFLYYEVIDGSGSWYPVAQVSLSYTYAFAFPRSSLPTTNPPPPEGCPNCDDERAALAAQCGGEQNIINWDENTCTGACKQPCPEAGTSAGSLEVPGMFASPVLCEDGCELVPSPASTGSGLNLSLSGKINGEWRTFLPYDYSGNTCVADSDKPVPPAPRDDCPTFMSRCEAACRGANTVDSFCNDTGRRCTCDLPAPPIVYDPDQDPPYQPDQDQDGQGSGGEDNDNDGDGVGNGDDGDVDGDGNENGNDGDVDGDGTGNGGLDGPGWDPPGDSEDGLGNGSDPDVDGDGLPNGSDPDVDGDGLPNGSDPDIDGDGIPNELDGDADGDGIGNGDDPEPYGPGGGTGGGSGGGDCVDDPATPEDECAGTGNGNCVDDPNTTQNECSEYGGIGSGKPNTPYSPGEFNIGDRFDTFISRIRQTGVFALPNDFFNDLPSGGSPVFSFEFGSYGTRTVDLSDMSQPLLILRTIVLIAFSFVCLRVVILKR